MTPGERIDAYRAAYRAANGKDIEVVFERGWFRVGGHFASKWRGKHLDECTAVLRMRAAASDAPEKPFHLSPNFNGNRP